MQSLRCANYHITDVHLLVPSLAACPDCGSDEAFNCITGQHEFWPAQREAKRRERAAAIAAAKAPAPAPQIEPQPVTVAPEPAPVVEIAPETATSDAPVVEITERRPRRR